MDFGETNGGLRIGGAPATKIVRDEALMRLLLQGFTIKEAGQQMRANYQVLCRVARQPEFLLKLREHSGEIAQRMVEELTTSQLTMSQRLEEASERALDEMLQLMGDSTGSLKYKVCQDILDRDVRTSRTKKMDLTGTMKHDFISPAVLIHAAATAKELQEFQEKKALGDGTNNPPGSGNGAGGGPVAGAPGQG